MHLNNEGTKILTDKTQHLLKNLKALHIPLSVERETESKRIETVISSRRMDQEAEYQDVPRSQAFVSSRLQKARGGNQFQAFAAKCSSPQEAMNIRDCVIKETTWKYPPDGPMTNLMWAASINGDVKHEDDRELGGGPRIAQCMSEIGMDNCIVLVARKCRQHIQGERWTIMQNLISEVATQMHYTVPNTLDIHSMFKEHGRKKREEKRRTTRYQTNQSDRVYAPQYNNRGYNRTEERSQGNTRSHRANEYPSDRTPSSGSQQIDHNMMSSHPQHPQPPVYPTEYQINPCAPPSSQENARGYEQTQEFYSANGVQIPVSVRDHSGYNIAYARPPVNSAQNTRSTMQEQVEQNRVYYPQLPQHPFNTGFQQTKHNMLQLHPPSHIPTSVPVPMLPNSQFNGYHGYHGHNIHQPGTAQQSLFNGLQQGLGLSNTGLSMRTQ